MTIPWYFWEYGPLILMVGWVAIAAIAIARTGTQEVKMGAFIGQVLMAVTGLALIIISLGWFELTTSAKIDRLRVKAGYIEVDGVKYDLMRRTGT